MSPIATARRTAIAAAASCLIGPSRPRRTPPRPPGPSAHPPYTAVDNVPYAPLNAISAVSASNVWAVGQSSGTPLIDQYNGSSWSQSTLPSGPCSVFEADCNLTGVSGNSASNVIAIGSGTIPTSAGWRGRDARVPVERLGLAGADRAEQHPQHRHGAHPGILAHRRVGGRDRSQRVGHGVGGRGGELERQHLDPGCHAVLHHGEPDRQRDLRRLGQRHLGRRRDGDARLHRRAEDVRDPALQRLGVDAGDRAGPEPGCSMSTRSRRPTPGPSRPTARC